MVKRMICFLLVICVIGSISAPTVFGTEMLITSQRETVKFGVTEYSDALKPDRMLDTYGAFNQGEWIEFKVNIQEAGNYYVGAYASHAGTPDILAVSVDGEAVGSGEVLPNGTWADFSMLSKLVTYEFDKGLHTIRITIEKSAGIHIGFFELGGVIDSSGTDFSRKSGAYKQSYLPTIINAENYDIGFESVASNDGKNSGGLYRPEEPLDIYEKSNLQNDYYIRLNNFEYANYSFNVEEYAIYTMTLKTKGNGQLSVYLDDMPYPLVYNVFGKEEYSRTTPVNILLSKGVHRIRVECSYSMIYLDDIEFTMQQSGDEYFTEDSFMSEIPEISSENVPTDEPDYDSLDAPNEVYKTIYVAPNGNDEGDGSESAPFATIERALSEVAASTASMTGDIIVSFASGVYTIDKTQMLSNEHGGKNGYNVVFRGEDSSNKPVFSGGQKVTGWQKCDELLWRAPLSGVDVVRNLYVNDYPATRARTKYLYMYEEDYKAEGSENKRDGFITSGTNFPQFSQPQYLETCWPDWWTLHMFPVENMKYMEDGKVALIMEQPAWDFPYEKVIGNSKKPTAGKNFYLVNAMELLDEPGEFYYNKDEGFIYYYPYKAEDMNTAETYIGKTETLFDIKGKSKENKLTNIVFDNIAFRYGAWDEASKLGYIMRQADGAVDIEAQSESNSDGTQILKSPGQIKINNTENLCITNCDFACIGSSALQLTDAVKNVKIEGNLLRDINGTGIIIGASHHATVNGKLKKTNTEPCQNFMIRNNVFTRVAYEYQSQTAITVYLEKNINIVHNDISHTPYSGISAGWGWEDTTTRADHHENIRITHNRISDTMENLIDGGPIYTLGNMGGSDISYNYISDCHYQEGGIYLDAGSSEESVHHNVVENAVHWFFLQAGYGAKDDFAYDNYSTTSRWTHSGELNNTVYNEPYILKRGKYPQEAIEIMQNAGVEDEYAYLLEEAKLPLWMKQVSAGTASTYFISEAEFEPKFGWIQAENYIRGEQGETYYDNYNTPKNNSYRDEGVGLIVREFKVGNYDGFVIHESGIGEWVTYKVKIPEDGEYTFKVNASHAYEDGGKFDLYVDNVLVIENGILTKGESGWNEVLETSFDGIHMTAGEHIIKYEFKDSGHFLDAIGFFSDKFPPDEEQNATDYDEGVFEYEVEIPEFEDISGHYAEQDIVAMRNEGIIKGVDEKTFAPDAQLTREQTAWLCLRAAEIPFNMDGWKDVAEDLGMISQKIENATAEVTAKFGWIQAEDFIPGKQGVTYYDNNNVFKNNIYRDEGVGLLKRDFKVGSYDGFVIHECGIGEWVTYKARIPEDGEYTFKVNASHPYEDGGKFDLYVDDVLVIENGNLPKGELGWDEILETSFDGIHMTAGEHIIKYEFKDAGHFLDAIGFFSDKFEEDEKELVFNKEIGKIDYDGTAAISREEFAHMIMCSYRSLYGELDDTSEISFTDKDTISEEYYQDILGACEAGLLLGDPEGTFRPKDGLTRAEAAVAIRRLLE